VTGGRGEGGPRVKGERPKAPMGRVFAGKKTERGGEKNESERKKTELGEEKEKESSGRRVFRTTIRPKKMEAWGNPSNEGEIERSLKKDRINGCRRREREQREWRSGGKKSQVAKLAKRQGDTNKKTVLI